MADEKTLDEMTKTELYEEAQERDIQGRSSMSEDELRQAVGQAREAEAGGDPDEQPDPSSGGTVEGGLSEEEGPYGEVSAEDKAAWVDTFTKRDPSGNQQGDNIPGGTSAEAPGASS